MMNNRRRSAFFRRSQEIPPIYLDPVLEQIGSISGSSKFIGGQLVDGSIYFCKHQASVVGKLDTLTEAYSSFGSGTIRNVGIVKAFNGKLYSGQYLGQSLKIDPSIDSITTLTDVGSGLNRWYGVSLAQNECIYGVPHTMNQFLKIDTATDVVTTFGSSTFSTPQYLGCVLAPTGKIIGIPASATQVCEIDPVDDSINFFGSISGSSKYWGGTVGLDDMIYCAPFGATNICKINPFTHEISFPVTGLGGGQKYTGAQLLADGRILFSPFGVQNALLFNPIDNSIEYLPITQSGGWTGLVHAEEAIYGVPFGEANILKVTNIPSWDSSAFEMPLDPADLPASLYNKVHNKL